MGYAYVDNLQAKKSSSLYSSSSDTVCFGDTLYGTCDTAASTAAKEVTLASFDHLAIGVMIRVKFTYSNTASNPTMSVNGTTAMNIYRYGTIPAGADVSTSWEEGEIVSFTYDGTAWVMNDYNLDYLNNRIYGKVFGFRIDGNEADPYERVTYLADAVGMTPAHMDYTNDRFDYGSWSDAWFVKETKPCILKPDKTVYCYIDKDDFTKDVNGNSLTTDYHLDNNMDTIGANVMIEFPKIWYKVVPFNNGKSADVYIANYNVDGTYKDYAYIDKQGNHKEHFYMSAYNGCIIVDALTHEDVMRSLSGMPVSYNKTAQQEIDLCTGKNAGWYTELGDTGWYTEDAGEVMLINFLLILLGKSTDTQTVFGQGLHTGGSSAINNNFRTGIQNTKGMFYGTNSGAIADGSYGNAVKVFGIENWWGFQWRRYAGDINDKGTRKIKLCYGREDDSTTDSFNLDGTGYVDVGATPSGTNGGYISDMKFTESGMYSKISSGSSSTYYTDGQWFYNGQVNYALRGGDSGGGSRVGALCVGLHATATAAYWNYGAALSCK